MPNKATPLLLAVFLVHPAAAELIGVDPFDYPNGGIAGRNGGQYFDWNSLGSSHTGTVSDWNTVFGAPTVTGSALHTDNSGALREYNGPGEGAGSDGAPTDERIGTIRSTGVVFYQFDMTRSLSLIHI